MEWSALGLGPGEMAVVGRAAGGVLFAPVAPAYRGQTSSLRGEIARHLPFKPAKSLRLSLKHGERAKPQDVDCPGWEEGNRKCRLRSVSIWLR